MSKFTMTASYNRALRSGWKHRGQWSIIRREAIYAQAGGLRLVLAMMERLGW